MRQARRFRSSTRSTGTPASSGWARSQQHWEGEPIGLTVTLCLRTGEQWGQEVRGHLPDRICNSAYVDYNRIRFITAQSRIALNAAVHTRPECRDGPAPKPGDLLLITKVSESGKASPSPQSSRNELTEPACGYLLALRGPHASGRWVPSTIPDQSPCGNRHAGPVQHSAAKHSTGSEPRGDAIRTGLFPVGRRTRHEQRDIADFLDRETAKIDALVAKKERLIELLQEKRTALITRVVTRGLDPNVPMKDSGVEWLGEIPAHWRVKRLWHIVAHAEQRRTPTNARTPSTGRDDPLGVVLKGLCQAPA